MIYLCDCFKNFLEYIFFDWLWKVEAIDLCTKCRVKLLNRDALEGFGYHVEFPIRLWIRIERSPRVNVGICGSFIEFTSFRASYRNIILWRDNLLRKGKVGSSSREFCLENGILWWKEHIESWLALLYHTSSLVLVNLSNMRISMPVAQSSHVSSFPVNVGPSAALPQGILSCWGQR